MSALTNLDPRALLDDGKALVEREAVYLDTRRWDDWLALFTEDCEYWMPAWRTESELTQDPRSELSHYYYASRAGLEDRLVRVLSGRSPASTPLPRTTHIVGNVQHLESPTADRMRLHVSWVGHVYFIRSHDSHAFFGHNEVDLIRDGDEWRIKRKKIVLQNDYIPTMLDFYCT